MFSAVKHALEYWCVGRALAVCSLAALVVIVFAFGLGVLLSTTAS
jgi:hypothetical protein